MSCQTRSSFFPPSALALAHLDSVATTGAMPSTASHVRLVIAAILRSPVCLGTRRRPPLRVRIVVVRVILDRPEQHHGVVLVNRVVAVHGIVPPEVPEAHHQLDLIVEPHLDDILPGELHVTRLDHPTVVLHDLELLQVNVDRVLPATRVVLQDPPFRRVPVHREADLVAIHEASVDLPLAVAALEAKLARDPGQRDRTRHQVAVVGDEPEGNRLAGIVGIGEEELVEAGRPTVQDPEAIAALLHLEERLEDAVHQQLVADQAVEPEEVEADLPRSRIEQLVGESKRDVEVGKGGEVETGILIARVELIEEELEAEEALVDVLRRVLDTVVVVPERALELEKALAWV